MQSNSDKWGVMQFNSDKCGAMALLERQNGLNWHSSSNNEN